ISIGTSSTVRPAAGLFWIAKSQNAKLIEINITSTKLTEFCDVVIQGSTSEILPKLFENI
ncbi:MAG TPA: NAD-dependent protein deacylase, partial [Dehalococcoidia bacterium]|nr:NAD-dependent protein deacylase [Dehalococcoidia bacterium]